MPLVVLPTQYFNMSAALDIYRVSRAKIAKNKEAGAKKLTEHNQPIKYTSGLYW